MGTLKEALDRLEEAKELLSEAIRNDLGIEPLRIEKIAVKVSNHREVKVVLDHLKKDFSFKITTFPSWIYLEPDRGFDNHYCYVKPGVDKIIDFDFFCAQKGLTPPKFIMDSVDGVPLYEGDEPCWVLREKDKWFIALEKNIVSAENKIMCSSYKMFSTKEAAEKWIEEQNKPKMILVSDDSQYPVEVYKNKIVIKCYGSDNHLDNLVVSGDELKEIINAFNSLQQQSDKTTSI